MRGGVVGAFQPSGKAYVGEPVAYRRASAHASGASKDAALLVTVNPGIYRAQVSGVASTTGVALVEIYLMP